MPNTPEPVGFPDNLSVDEGVDEVHDALHKGREAVRQIEAYARAKKLSERWVHIWGNSLRIAVIEAVEALTELKELGYPVRLPKELPEAFPTLEPVTKEGSF